VRCGDCDETRLVAFSCKGRGFCPSCVGRRMCATAANLVERVGLASTGGTLQEVRLPEARWSGSCEFTAAGAARPRTKTVSLDARELNGTEWP